MKAIHLQVNNLFAPMGIGDQYPCFSWHCEGGMKQTAYQIVASRNGEVIWDSEKVASSRMNGIRYMGRRLASRDMVTWKVCLWDENDVKGEETSSSFEMGLLEKEDWKARWIKGNYKVDSHKRYPVDCFRRSFVLEDVRKARLYASARGVYDVFINGKRLEDFILAPGITDYRKRIQYQTYDVERYLQVGENVIEFRLADGWYRGSSAAYGAVNVYGTETSLIAQLEMGGLVIVRTDAGFEWSNDGPIEFADLKDGEIVNANKRPSYSGKAVLARQEGNLVASDNVYVREKETFKARLVKKEVNKYVFDFGQNLAGYISFRLSAEKNDRLTIVCGETLDKDNNVDMSLIQLPKPAKGWTQASTFISMIGYPPKKDIVMTPLQKIVYTCREGLNEYKTSFAVFGFRYIEVISNVPLDETMFESIAVYSDMEQTGDFECSSELINQFVRNVRWSMKSNFLDVPTDCPTRERLGWTGDAQIFFNSGSYLMDISAFFRKWINDMEDAQMKKGVIPSVLPYEGVSMMYDNSGTSVGWADAIYLVPYRYYKKYNDLSILKKTWPMIRRYGDYLFSHTGFRTKKETREHPELERFVYDKGVHLGEWLEPEEFRDPVMGAMGSHLEECTAYFHYSMKTIGEIAELMGDDDYAFRCREYAEGAKAAYNILFVKDGTIDTPRQAKLVRPLALGLVEGKVKENVQKRLKKAIEDYDHRVGTGFLSTPFILPVLEEAGYLDTAFKVLENEKAPGWLSEVKAGATTVWESWEGDASLNHYSPGASIEWLFSSVAGINVDLDNHIIFKPVFDASLDHVHCRYDSVYGTIRTAWKKAEEGYTYSVEVPSNTTATLYINGMTVNLNPGIHTFTAG